VTTKVREYNLGGIEVNVLSTKEYEVTLEGISMFSGDKVLVHGEQTVELEDGRIVEQYLYNIEGYTPKNGLPFVSLKANIIL
jgi:hypothetical protein